MDRRVFIKTSGVVAAHAAVFSGKALGAEPHTRPQLAPPVNPFEQDGQWYKSAFHVHTTTSDGDVDVPTRIAEYRDHGYAVVAVTDHWKTNDLSGFSDARFLAINGMEMHPRTGTGAPAHHFVCLDLPHPFELDRAMPAQDMIDKVLAVGGVVIYAHPYWTAHTMEEMSEVEGYVGVEVYNSHCDFGNAKGFNTVHWDQMLNKGLMLAGMATDDVHRTDWIDGGWTMVKAKSLTKADIMAAVAGGSYYASCGPTIEDFRVKDGVVSLRCSAAAQIRFQFDAHGGGRVHNADPGQSITEAKWDFGARRSKPKWIRAEVIDADGRHAWTNPIVVGESA